MTITLNGEQTDLTAATTVAELLEQRGLAGTPCAVEVNGSLVRKGDHAERTLADGDRVELVTLVGGG